MPLHVEEIKEGFDHDQSMAPAWTWFYFFSDNKRAKCCSEQIKLGCTSSVYGLRKMVPMQARANEVLQFMFAGQSHAGLHEVA